MTTEHALSVSEQNNNIFRLVAAMGLTGSDKAGIFWR